MNVRFISFVVKLGCYLAFPVLFIVIPTSFFESMHSVCLYKNIFHVECPGCGMIRAISRVFHGDLAGAFYYNKLIVPTLPILTYVYLQSLKFEYEKRVLKKSHRKSRAASALSVTNISQ